MDKITFLASAEREKYISHSDICLGTVLVMFHYVLHLLTIGYEEQFGRSDHWIIVASKNIELIHLKEGLCIRVVHHKSN